MSSNQILLNGEPCEIKESISIENFLQLHELKASYQAIALNGTVVKNSELTQIELKSGDQLDIVRPIGGG